MTFKIVISHDRRNYRFIVKQLPSSGSFDFYEVVARNGSMILRNNAPVFRRHSLKHRRLEWKVTAGDIWNGAFREKLIEAVDKNVQSIK